MPKVSVIVPVYNVERYLHQCLDSIIGQTLQDIEIICIDDGSTDASPEILDEYAVMDSRVVAIHKENEGYGKAMNVGIDAAKGKYIGIVESDDFILPEMYQTLYDAAEAGQLDLVKSDYFNFLRGCAMPTHINGLDSYYNTVLGDGQREVMFKFRMHNWTGIYLRDFLNANHIRHQETPGASYQDNGFWLQIMAQCRRAMWLDQAFYMYRQDNPMSSMKRRDRLRITIEEHNFAERILRAKGLERELRICAFYRENDHLFTFRRIDDSLKREYADIAVEDYQKYKPMIVPEYFSQYPDLFRWLDAMSDNPDAVCNSIFQRNAKTIDCLTSAERIVIYGAGKVASGICVNLFNVGFYHKIDCVTVTGDPVEKDFMGLPLKSSAVIGQYETPPLVVVAVSKKYKAYTEIISALRELRCNHYLDVDDFQYLGV